MTLVELLIAVAIVAILVAIAMPNFESTIASNRLSSATTEMTALLAQARSEAIRRGKRVTACVSADGSTCASSGDWSQGWIYFEDGTRASGGSSPALDSGDTIIGVAMAAPNKISISGTASLAQYVSFSPRGESVTAARVGETNAGRIRVCSKSTTLDNDLRAREITITAAGRIVSAKVTGVTSSCPAPT